MALINTIGRQIKMYRIANNMTQKELAEKSGISQTHISYYERGTANKEQNNITINTLERIAKALNVKVTELLLEVPEEDIDYNIGDGDDAAETIINQKLRECYYPPIVSGYQISSLLEFIIYLPLLRQEDIVDMINRIGGRVVNYEYYISSLIAKAINNIPDSLQKEYADRIVQHIRKIRNEKAAINDMDNATREMYQAYHKEVEKKINFYSTINKLELEFVLMNKKKIIDIIKYFDQFDKPSK